jgi:hypothetical protein
MNDKFKEALQDAKNAIIVFFLIIVGYAIYGNFFRASAREKMQEDLVGEYYWDPGLGNEIKVFLKEDSTWRKDYYKNGVLNKPMFPEDFSGKYRIIDKVIKKADESYEVSIVSFDNGKSGYLFNGNCFKGLSDDIWLQTGIKTAEDPFPGINEGGGRSYCKK